MSLDPLDAPPPAATGRPREGLATLDLLLKRHPGHAAALDLRRQLQ